MCTTYQAQHAWVALMMLVMFRGSVSSGHGLATGWPTGELGRLEE